MGHSDLAGRGDLFLRGSNAFQSAEAIEHHDRASGGKRVSDDPIR
jgi:hypothetical protein